MHHVWLQLLTGKGALGQLRLETSLSPSILKALVGSIVVFNLVTALLPNATFSEENQKDVRKRPAGTYCSCLLACLFVCNFVFCLRIDLHLRAEGKLATHQSIA